MDNRYEERLGTQKMLPLIMNMTGSLTVSTS